MKYTNQFNDTEQNLYQVKFFWNNDLFYGEFNIFIYNMKSILMYFLFISLFK